MKLPPVLLVEWTDALHPGGVWASLASMEAPLPVIYSAGFLVHQDAEKLVVAAAFDGEHATGEVTIPRSAVKHRKVLAKAREL